MVAAFEIKETVVDAAQRPGLDFERLAKQFIFGSRGVNGLAKKTADGVVVTFSQRPDVYARAVEAASTAKLNWFSISQTSWNSRNAHRPKDLS